MRVVLHESNTDDKSLEINQIVSQLRLLDWKYSGIAARKSTSPRCHRTQLHLTLKRVSTNYNEALCNFLDFVLKSLLQNLTALYHFIHQHLQNIVFRSYYTSIIQKFNIIRWAYTHLAIAAASLPPFTIYVINIQDFVLNK